MFQSPRQFAAPLAAIVVMAGAATGCGTFSQQAELLVRVVDARSGQAIVGATVAADYLSKRTGAGGQVRLLLKPDMYDLTVEHPAFLSMTTTVVIVSGVGAAKTIGLYPRPGGVEPLPGPGPDPIPSNGPGPSPGPSGAPSTAPEKGAAIFGRVTDESGARIPNAMVFAESGWGIPLGNARTNAHGEYRVEKLSRGQQARVTVIADGYKSVTRAATPAGEWRMDFTGAYALRRDVPPPPDPAGPPTVRVEGRVEDSMGRPLDGAIIKAESENVRYPFSQMAVARGGRFELKCPAEVPIRFTASKVAHRPVTFTERLERPGFGGDVRVEFTGIRALDPTPVFEGGQAR